MGFSRQEYWSELPFPSPGDLLYPGIEPTSPALQADSSPSWVTREAPLKIRQPLKIALKRNSKSEVPTALVLIINLPIYKPTWLPNHQLLAQYANEKNIGKPSLYRNHKFHVCYEALLQSLRRLCSLFNWTAGPWRLVPGCCFITLAWGGAGPGPDHHPRVWACLGQLEGRGRWLMSEMSPGASWGRTVSKPAGDVARRSGPRPQAGVPVRPDPARDSLSPLEALGLTLTCSHQSPGQAAKIKAKYQLEE